MQTVTTGDTLESRGNTMTTPGEGEMERSESHEPFIPLQNLDGVIAEDKCDIRKESEDDKMDGKATKFVLDEDDPLCEDIISCISALDEMLAEFDDTSLPYTGELESCGDPLHPTTSEIVVNSGLPVTSAAAALSHSTNDNSRILLPEPNHKLIDQNENVDWTTSPVTRNSRPLIHTSHLIQIPVVESASQLGSSFNRNKNIAGRQMEELNGNNGSKFEGQSVKGKSSSQPRVATGTYSKGTSYEINIPKIPPDDFDSSGISCGKGTITTSSQPNRASIIVPVIESDSKESENGNVNKVRSQLNLGLFQKTAHASHVPVLAEGANAVIEGRDGSSKRITSNSLRDMEKKERDTSGGISSTYISVAEQKPTGEKSNGPFSGSSGGIMKCDEEQWNFPSEKNLPRSLRKTRKTCFLEDGGDDSKGKGSRAESPYCCSSTDSPELSRLDEMGGRGGSGIKSPKVMPRKGMLSKCEIVNKEDGSFALHKWNGQNNQEHTTVISTSSSPSASTREVVGRGNRRKIYEDVVLSKTTFDTSPLPIVERRLEHFKNNNGVEDSSSFPGGSGVTLSVTNNPPVRQAENASPGMFQKVSSVSKLRSGPIQQPAAIPKPRLRQQIPSPGADLPTPKSSCDVPPNQFIPDSALMMPTHQSPKHLEIGSEEGNIGRQMIYPDDSSSNDTSPIKHASGLRKSSLDAEFEETASDSKILKMEGKSRRNNAKSHSNNCYETSGNNGSLPNQSQMMRMVMMMKSSGRNTSVSSSRSSSSSGSVSVKSSSSSDNNCGDVFHENIVQDYPTNIFNVAPVVVQTQDTVEAKPSPRIEKKEGESKKAAVCSGEVVVLRAKEPGRGNAQPGCSKPRGIARGGNGGNLPGTTLDIDDGYLSMINRNEAPLLWPEEFIANETFSQDELKRLSVHLDGDYEGDDTDVEDFDASHSAGLPNPKKCEKVSKKSNFPNRSSMSSSSNSNTSSSNTGKMQQRRDRSSSGVVASSSGAGRSSTEKTDYFSDDSLELDEEEMVLIQAVDNHPKTEEVVVVRAATSFVIPFSKDEKQAEKKKEKQVGRKGASQLSKIPKMLSPVGNNRRGSGGNIQKIQYSTEGRSSSPTVKKPCSFFIPFAGDSGEGKLISDARSSSVPTSRRNSDCKKDGITWDISSGSGHKGQETKVNETCTDFESSNPNPTNNNMKEADVVKEKVLSEQIILTKGETGKFASSIPTLSNPANNPTSIKAKGDGNVGVNKRKFEKQQTFIVANCRDITTSGGQRLIDQDEKGVKQANHDLTPDKLTETLAETNDLEKVVPALQQEHISNMSDVLKELDKLSDESANMISEGKSDKKKVDGGLEGVRDHEQNSPMILQVTESFEELSNNDERKVENADGEDKYSSEDHEMATDELESVVKMFLKATEGLLNQEEFGKEDGEDKCEEKVDDVTNSDKGKEVEQEKQEEVDSIQRTQEHEQLPVEVSILSLSDMNGQVPLMTSTPKPVCKELAEDLLVKEPSDCPKRLSFQLLSELDEEETVIEDLHLQPPTFIPEPPPKAIAPKDVVIQPAHKNQHSLDGKVALDILSQRINTRNCPSPVENMSVSQFLHNKKNIWAMYDRPYDEDVLPQSFPRGYASRSQENIVDAMTHERLTKSFSARGQSSTLPLNCRPPPVQRRTSTFRNMFNKFRKHKQADISIPETSELRDDEVQSITSRETGQSEGKKRGFFSRLFRRSRKH